MSTMSERELRGLVESTVREEVENRGIDTMEDLEYLNTEDLRLDSDEVDCSIGQYNITGDMQGEIEMPFEEDTMTVSYYLTKNDEGDDYTLDYEIDA